jgi:hypothetical protein
MRTYLNDTVYNGFPTDLRVLKDAIIDTTVVSGHGSIAGETNFVTTDKIYLLSTHEVWEDDDGNANSGIDRFDTAYFNTRQLDYYASLNVTTSNPAGASKVGRTYWWLRSATSPNFYSFHAVMSNGGWGYNPGHYYSGVSLVFRIA